MASSFVITIKDARSQTDLSRFIETSSKPRDAARMIRNYFTRVMGGLESVNFDLQTSSAAPVRASVAVTLTYASIANNDTITVAGQALTCVTGTPTTHQFKKVTDATTTAANLVALINSDSGTKQYVSASNVAGVVTIKALAAGAIGNLVTIATSNGSGFTFTGSTLANGAGGAETVAVNYSRGL